MSVVVKAAERHHLTVPELVLREVEFRVFRESKFREPDPVAK